MKRKITAPVLLIAFNRPDTTEKVFQKIREAQPTKLYVAVDGARPGKDGEAHIIEQVKEITKNVNWDCQTHYKFNEKNLGAEITVSAAVTWALENEEYVIVLEDDIIAPFSFFRFVQEMLIKYSDNKSVYMISGGQFTPIETPNNEDYLFGLYGHTGCGWGTWKRAWRKFDLGVNDFDKVLNGSVLDSLCLFNKEKMYIIRSITKMKENGAGNNTWDRCWAYIRIKEHGLSIIPKNNLTSNIGIYGLHARGQTENHFRAYDENYIATRHPEKIKRNIEYDKYHFLKYINKRPSLLKRAIKKAKRMLVK